MLREANNNAFANAGCAYLAFESPEGGLAAVEAGIGEDSEQKYQLEGFREIDRARKMASEPSADKAAVNDMFWKGNYLLLKHEQWGVIQQHFEKLELPLGLALTIITSLDINANRFARSHAT